jgi:hypothetical protein
VAALETPSYEVVERKVPMTDTPRRPIVIVGAEASRIGQAVQRLVKHIDFVHAVPHTTRPPREGEVGIVMEAVGLLVSFVSLYFCVWC